MPDGGDPRGGCRRNPVSRELGFCPCCGYRTLSPDEPGSYEVCEICAWVDDLVGFYHQEAQSDYNHVSLSAARENVQQVGACLPGLDGDTREPGESDERDPNYPYDRE